MKSFFLSAILLLASTLTSALPAAVPEAAPEPEELEARQSTTVTSSLLVRIIEDWPDTAFGDGPGVVSRYNGAHNIQTLVQFTFNQGYSGRQCQLRFRNPSALWGSQQAQVYTVGGQITTQNTYNSRPYRDQHRGTFTASWSGLATWTYVGGDTFACPSSATTLNYEVVPVNDNDYISWNSGDGLIIAVL